MTAQGQEKPRCWVGVGLELGVGGRDCHQTRAGQQQAGGWGNSAAAAGLVSLLPARDEWRAKKKEKANKGVPNLDAASFPPSLSDH